MGSAKKASEVAQERTLTEKRQVYVWKAGFCKFLVTEADISVKGIEILSMFIALPE